MQGRVFIIAGSDSGGGAGIQADIKTVSAMGAYAASAITMVTVQNTMGVHAVHDVPTDVVRGRGVGVASLPRNIRKGNTVYVTIAAHHSTTSQSDRSTCRFSPISKWSPSTFCTVRSWPAALHPRH